MSGTSRRRGNLDLLNRRDVPVEILPRGDVLTNQVLITILGFLRLHFRCIESRTGALPLGVWTKRRNRGRGASTIEAHPQGAASGGPEALGACRWALEGSSGFTIDK